MTVLHKEISDTHRVGPVVSRASRPGVVCRGIGTGSVEAFVLALHGRFMALPGDRLHPERLQIGDELAKHAPAGRVQRGPVIGQQPLRNPARGNALLRHSDRCLGGFSPGDMGGDREAGVVIDGLEDRTFSTTDEDIFGPVQLPARVPRRGAQGRRNEGAFDECGDGGSAS